MGPPAHGLRGNSERGAVAQQASPLEEECEAEGQIVCHQGRIKGQPGVAMDDLIYVSTKVPPPPLPGPRLTPPAREPRSCAGPRACAPAGPQKFHPAPRAVCRG